MRVKPLLIIIIVLFCSSRQALSQSPDTLKVSRRNPTGALLCSAIVPGLGQFYNRKYIKGTIIAGAQLWLLNGIYNDWKAADKHEWNFKHTDDLIYKSSEFTSYESSRDRRNLKLWIMAATVFYSMFDAYVDAQLSDFNQKDKAYEVLVAPTGDDGMQVMLTFDIP